MFELINGNVEIDPDLIGAYPEFKALWDRDTTDDKHEAFAYFRYMFHFYNPKSPIHKGYPDSARRQEIIDQVFPEHMKQLEFYNDKEFIRACNVFKEQLNLSTMRTVLDLAKQVVHDITGTLKAQKTAAGTKLNSLRRLNEALEEIERTEKLIQADEKNNVKGKRVLKEREK